jgi:hypothetical protein
MSEKNTSEEELILIDLTEPLPPRGLDESDWNGWHLLPGGELEHEEASYPIDVQQFTRSAKALDMIMQIATKTWATDAVLAGLVRAINDVVEPQATLCSFGSDKFLAKAKIMKRVRWIMRVRRAHAKIRKKQPCNDQPGDTSL